MSGRLGLQHVSFKETILNESRSVGLEIGPSLTSNNKVFRAGTTKMFNATYLV